jgi:hypothetical protein
MFLQQISGCCKVWSLCHLRFPHRLTKAMKPQELDPSFHPIAAISSSPHMNSSGNRGCGNESNVYSRIAARNGHRCRREVYIEQLHLRHIIARCCKILQASSILYHLIRFDPCKNCYLSGNTSFQAPYAAKLEHELRLKAWDLMIFGCFTKSHFGTHTHTYIYDHICIIMYIYIYMAVHRCSRTFLHRRSWCRNHLNI